MIIIRLQGGLGNQMFQYALGRRLEMVNGLDVRYDVAGFREDFYARTYSLGCFCVVVRFADPDDGKKVTASADRLNGVQRVIRRLLRRWVGRYGLITERGSGFDASIHRLKRDACLRGYWGSEKYFAAAAGFIRDDFTLRPEQQTHLDADVLDSICSSNSVGVHLRRQFGHSADGRINPAAFAFHGTLPMAYYRGAFEVIARQISNPRFFVFSDDPEWCRANLRMDAPLHFVASQRDYEDLWLMHYCRHQIIANSSFSWWAAWLNPNPQKVVVAPKTWLADARADTRDVCPGRWLRL